MLVLMSMFCVYVDDVGGAGVVKDVGAVAVVVVGGGGGGGVG